MSDTGSSNGKQKAEVHPSGDDRYVALDRTMKRFHNE
ncbi:unnamed protein product, partial [marine sediment metagenome]